MIKELRVFVVKNGCPLCGGDVIGNDKVKYYCKHCNMLFNFKDLRKDAIENLDKGNRERAASERNKKKGKKKRNEEKSYDEKKNQKYFVASVLSDKFHIPQCPFAKNINKKNLIVFKSRAEARKAGFKACKCSKL